VKAISRRRDRHHSAFTFIELLTIVALLGIAAYFAGSATSGQSSYYQLRGDVERIVAGLQRASVVSSGRGDLLNPLTNKRITSGVTFFQGQMTPSFQFQSYATVNAFAFVNWYDSALGNIGQTTAADATAIPPPTGSLSQNASAGDRQVQSASKALRTETYLCKRYNGANSSAGVTALADQATFTFFRGGLDVFDNAGNLVPGNVTTLGNNFTAVPSVRTAGVTVAWEFDVVNFNVGWVRVRVLSGGFAEVSGINAIGTTTPLTVSGGAF